MNKSNSTLTVEAFLSERNQATLSEQLPNFQGSPWLNHPIFLHLLDLLLLSIKILNSGVNLSLVQGLTSHVSIIPIKLSRSIHREWRKKQNKMIKKLLHPSDLKIHALSMLGICVNSWSNLDWQAYSSSVDASIPICTSMSELGFELFRLTQLKNLCWKSYDHKHINN